MHLLQQGEQGGALSYLKRLLAMGKSEVQYRLFDVNESLSRLTRGIP